MAYRALYRQWRPKDFSHVVGQKAIMDTLRNQVLHDRIAHAYLFCGSRGTGKTSTAKILSRAINCENPQNGDPCGKCASCERLEHEECLDIIEIDAASNNGVDEMRDLRDSVKYPPQFGRFKVYIIDEVHMLSASAFNALLKTLEEPPAHVVFILATTEPQKLPETILSRCQRFDFGRIATRDIAGRLKEASAAAGAEVSDGALMMIARAAEGGMRDALSILDMCLGYGDHIDERMVRGILGTSDRSFLFRFGQALADENSAEVFEMIDEMMRDGRDPGVFAREVSQHIRSLLLAKSCPDDVARLLDLTDEDASEYRNQAEAYTYSRLMRILDLFMPLEVEMRFSGSPRIALEMTSLKACIRSSETDQRALLDRIEELNRRIDQLSETAEKGGLRMSSADQAEPPADKGKSIRKPVAAVQKHPEPAQPETIGIELWDHVMDRIKKTDPGMYMMLTQGRIIEIRNNTYRWKPNTQKDEVFRSSLTREEKVKAISMILSELAQAPCTFETVPFSADEKQGDSSDETYLNHLYDTFGKEPVDVVDHL